MGSMGPGSHGVFGEQGAALGSATLGAAAQLSSRPCSAAGKRPAAPPMRLKHHKPPQLTESKDTSEVSGVRRAALPHAVQGRAAPNPPRPK